MISEKQVYRALSKRLPSAEKRRVAIVTGARQTGKTTLLKVAYPRLRYLTFDVYENREWARSVSAFDWAERVGSAIIDEAQKEPDVFEKVKYAYDEQKLAFSVLSGSAQVLLLSQVRESLAGRAFVMELWPLMFSELASSILEREWQEPLIASILKGNEIGKILKELPETLPPEEENSLRNIQEHLLQWGGMPELLRLDDDERTEWLRAYETTYLERDLADLARLSDLEPFKKFQRLAALRGGQMLSYSELARDAGVSVETARRYLEYLRLSYQSFTLPPYHANLTSQVVKTPKLYWVDSGIRRQVAGLRTMPLQGEDFENFVVGELLKWTRTSGGEERLYYYRTRSGLECDLLIETGRGLFGVEIKSRERAVKTDASALRQIAKAAGKRWLGGMVVHSGNHLGRLCEPDIWSVPAFRLLG